MRLFVALLTAAACAACTLPATRPGEAPAGVPSDLRLATEPAAVIKGARALMEADQNVGLVTVDDSGRPRIRTVRAFLDPVDPERQSSGFTVWVMTRLSTRKIEQIRADPRVTLYFNDDAQVTYASIMGRAVVHTDPEHAAAKRHYDTEDAKFFWPDFPRDFVMLEVCPQWLEYIGPGVANDDRTWRPQAVVFE